MNKVVKLYLLLPLLLLPALKSTAQFTFNFNERCRSAYHKMMQLRIKGAGQLIHLEKKENAGNLVPFFLDNYALTFQLLFNGDRSDYNSFLKESQKNLEQVKKGPSDSPYYLYMQSVMNLQSAACKYKFGDLMGAFWDVRSAYLQIIKNNKNYPDFTLNKIVLGPMKALVGSIPPGYKWAAGLLGLKGGGVKEGIDLMHSFLAGEQGTADFFKEEAIFYYIYMIFYLEQDTDKAIDVIEQYHLDLRKNRLYTFMAANLYLNDHKAEDAVKILTNLDTSAAYLPMPILNYELATGYLNHLKLEKAIDAFQYFLQHYKGELYVKDALYRLSWAYGLKGDYAGAAKYRKLVLSKGSTVTDADKVAQREVAAGIHQPSAILQARLLLDGGYFQEALEKLRHHPEEKDWSLLDQVRYSYFLARIRDEMGAEDEALVLYEKVLKEGAELPEYYAARAALQAGLIYEKRGENKKALIYFQKCLDMPNKEYKESLDQRAKSGINRITVQ